MDKKKKNNFKKIWMIIFFVLLFCENINAENSFLECELSKLGYEIVATDIGRSEFGQVFLAKYGDDLLCLKCIPEKKFLENEFYLFRNLQIRNCKNITQTYDKLLIAINSSNIVVLTMQYNAGGTILDIWCDKTTGKFRYDPNSVFEMFKCISYALRVIHESGYVYKDIKPANIMFDGNTYKLIDFGLLSAISGPKDGSGCWLYKAPEVLMYIDKKVTDYDDKADVWSLAAMVCHIFLGEFPYDTFNYDSGKILPIDLILKNQLRFCKKIPRIEPIDFYNTIKKCLEFNFAYRLCSQELCDILESLKR